MNILSEYASKAAGLLLAAYCCAACSQTDTPESTEKEVISVTRKVEVTLMPIGTVTPLTRHAGNQTAEEKEETICLSYDTDAQSRAPNGLDEMTEAEAKINNAYLVQFNGTTATSIAKVVLDITANLKNGTAISPTFEFTPSIYNRVYVVANCATAPTKGMTLGDFEKPVPYTTPASGLPTIGGAQCLPMSAFQDVGAGDSFSVFQLRSVLARLKVNCKSSFTSIKLFGVPSGYTLHTIEGNDEPVRTADITYTQTATLTNNSYCYIPANLSGKRDIDMFVMRCSVFAPADAMYIQIAANNTTYNVYLGDGDVRDFNVEPNYAYNLIVTLSGTSTNDLRVGTPTITALDANGTANCYIVTKANAWYSFNATVMGNGQTTPAYTVTDQYFIDKGHMSFPAIVPQTLDTHTAEVLWETNNTTTEVVPGSIIPKVYLTNDKIMFRAGATEGNAVIAARDPKEGIIWSWHIWRTNEDPTASPFTLADITGEYNFSNGASTISGMQLMDRNLGALKATLDTPLSIGLNYQWGRKDPFPGGAVFPAIYQDTDLPLMTQVPALLEATTTTASVDESIVNPTRFYGTAVYSVNMSTNKPDSEDWTTERNDNLWGTPFGEYDGSMSYNIGSKTIYDPCPAGWRVPQGFTFINMPTGNKTNFPAEITAEENGFSISTPFGNSSEIFRIPFAIYLSASSSKLKTCQRRAGFHTSMPYITTTAGTCRSYFLSMARTHNTTLSTGEEKIVLNSQINIKYEHARPHPVRCCKEIK